MKNTVVAGIGIIGSFISTLFGGWDTGLVTLCIAMAVDYITGWIVAGVFQKSEKSENGGLSSSAGFKGLAKKGVILLFVLMAYRLDLTVGSTYIRDAVIIAFIANEVISITENAGLMGIPIPAVIIKAIDILKKREDNGGEDGVQKD